MTSSEHVRKWYVNGSVTDCFATLLPLPRESLHDHMNLSGGRTCHLRCPPRSVSWSPGWVLCSGPRFHSCGLVEMLPISWHLLVLLALAQGEWVALGYFTLMWSHVVQRLRNMTPWICEMCRLWNCWSCTGFINRRSGVRYSLFLTPLYIIPYTNRETKYQTSHPCSGGETNEEAGLVDHTPKNANDWCVIWKEGGVWWKYFSIHLVLHLGEVHWSQQMSQKWMRIYSSLSLTFSNM